VKLTEVSTLAFQLFYGKLYTHLNKKWIFLIALFIFELGSLICGVAPSSVAFIVGRAIAGLGAAGLLNGSMIIVAEKVTIERRPTFTGMIGGMYGIASVAGPLVCHFFSCQR
jgi:MFS family permease